MMYVIALLAMAGGMLASLFTLIMLLAGGANSTPPKIRALKIMMLAIASIGGVAMIAAVVLFARGLPGWAAGAGALPLVVCVGLIVWMVKTEF